jgi:hypothetical protein
MIIDTDNLGIELINSMERFRKENLIHYPDLPGLIILRAYMWMAINFQVVFPEDTIPDIQKWVEVHRTSLESELSTLEKMYSATAILAEEYVRAYEEGELFSDHNDDEVTRAIQKVKESEDYDYQLISGLADLFHVVIREKKGIDRFQGEDIYVHHLEWLEKSIKKMRGRYEKELSLCLDILKNINRYDPKKESEAA